MSSFDEYLESQKVALLELTVASSYKLLTTKFAILAWGPIGPLFKLLLEKFIWFLITKTELAIFLKYTDMRVGKQGKELQSAITYFHSLTKSGTDKEKLDAKNKLKDAFRNLVKFSS